MQTHVQTGCPQPPPEATETLKGGKSKNASGISRAICQLTGPGLGTRADAGAGTISTTTGGERKPNKPSATPNEYASPTPATVANVSDVAAEDVEWMPLEQFLKISRRFSAKNCNETVQY